MLSRAALLSLALVLAGCFRAGDPFQPLVVPVDTPPSLWQLQHHQDVWDGNRPLHWVEIGDPALPAVFFVHGSPGSWLAWRHLLSDPHLLAVARLIAVDRPGFGGSEPGRAEASLVAQVAALAPALAAAQGPDGRRPILVGHSLGGPVIARAAMDHPEQVGGLLLIAPSIDPELEELRWFNKVATWKIVNWAIDRDLLTSNREILPLRAELEAMLPLWSRLDLPVIVLQGEQDRLVPPANAEFAARQLAHTRVEIERVPEQGHFILWERPLLIRAALLRLLGADDRRPGGA